MFIDGRAVPQDHVFENDVCIIGAGAAGLTLATALDRFGVGVDLVESGGLKSIPRTQRLTRVKLRDKEHFANRLRFFGGTTNHWGGWCQPLETFEFEQHPWVPDSGWPFGRSELEPYYEASRDVLGLPQPGYRFEAAAEAAYPEPPLLEDQSEFRSVIWRKTQPGPLRMREKYGDAIAGSKNVRCVLHGNALELLPNREGRLIELVSARTLTKRRMTFRARRYVLATGCLENARLLLLSDSIVRGGIGNQNDCVGRYLCDHGFLSMGRVLLPGRSSAPVFREERFFPEREGPDGRTDGVGYATTEAYRTRNRSLGFAAAVGTFREDDRSAPAIEELVRAADGDGGARPSQPSRSFVLAVSAEQAPNRESRLVLDPDKDALGQRKARVVHRSTDLDHRSRRESIERLAALVARSGRGRVKLEPFDPRGWMPAVAGHQTGSARMSEDPKKGVTDGNGRVHGVANLFVTGGAVYPTAGWQHPTLTIVALALRLADHLKAGGGVPG
ncbi:MAG: GMC oxidoreductase [Myxococcota bacterium]